MNPKTRHELWYGKAGPIEVSIDEPTTASKGLAVIAHPHPLFGGTKDNKVVQTLARAFLQLGYMTLRFNFRGVGQSAGVHDNGQGECDDLVDLTQRARATLLPAGLKTSQSPWPVFHLVPLSPAMPPSACAIQVLKSESLPLWAQPQAGSPWPKCRKTPW